MDLVLFRFSSSIRLLRNHVLLIEFQFLLLLLIFYHAHATTSSKSSTSRSCYHLLFTSPLFAPQNKTGIIDLTTHRCYVMPLDRNHVLPPRSVYDLIKKIWMGEFLGTLCFYISSFHTYPLYTMPCLFFLFLHYRRECRRKDRTKQSKEWKLLHFYMQHVDCDLITLHLLFAKPRPFASNTNLLDHL